MMVKLVNHITGGEMWVDESRAPEYLAAGHALAAGAGAAPKQEKAPPKKKNAKR